MNYYPNNFYSNYPYFQQQQIPQNNYINGKIVDSQEMVRASDVPFNSYGIFPKGDFSEIYMKTWNNNGTTQIKVYRPIPVEEQSGEDYQNLINRIIELENQVQGLIKTSQFSSKEESSTAIQKPLSETKRKEMNF